MSFYLPQQNRNYLCLSAREAENNCRCNNFSEINKKLFAVEGQERDIEQILSVSTGRLLSLSERITITKPRPLCVLLILIC